MSDERRSDYERSIALLAQRFPIPIEDAITYWQTVGRWGHGDVRVLRRLVEERLHRHLEPGDSISTAYAPIPRHHAVSAVRGWPEEMPHPEFLDWAHERLLSTLLRGEIPIPYVAFQGQRGNPTRGSKAHMFVNLLLAAPGWIEVTDNHGRRRIETSAAKTTSPRTSPRSARTACPKCFLELPATGVCETCESS